MKRLWLMLTSAFKRPIRIGDVVIDPWDGKRKTVERVVDNRVVLVYFVGTKLRRESTGMRFLTRA